MRNARLDRITPKLIEQFKAYRLKQVGLVYMQHSLRALRRALRLAVQKFEYRFVVPKFDLHREPQREYVLAEADFQRILEICGMPEQQVSPTVKVTEGAGRETMQAVLTVLYDCGIRPSEAVRLTWDRVRSARPVDFHRHRQVEGGPQTAADYSPCFCRNRWPKG